jgi:hypothetical protein
VLCCVAFFFVLCCLLLFCVVLFCSGVVLFCVVLSLSCAVLSCVVLSCLMRVWSVRARASILLSVCFLLVCLPVSAPLVCVFSVMACNPVSSFSCLSLSRVYHLYLLRVGGSVWCIL